MDHLSDALDRFRCYKDLDKEDFLRTKAFAFLERGWCSVYLIVDEDAFEIIRASSALIPCRCVLVECSENPKVQKVYKDYHFSEFQYDGEHYQFYKRL